MTGLIWAISFVVGALVLIWIELCHIEKVLTIIALDDGNNWKWKE